MPFGERNVLTTYRALLNRICADAQLGSDRALKCSQTANRLAFIGQDRFPAGLITLNMEAAMHNTDQRNKLGAIVLHENNVLVSGNEYRRVACPHRLVIDG